MKRLQSFLIYILLALSFIMLLTVVGCKDDPEEETGTVNIKLYDARTPHTSSKTTAAGIIDAEQLTKCEITYSSIQLKTSQGEYIELLTSPTTVDLRNMQGTVSSFLSASIPIGSYTAISITVSGVSTTYQNNNYTASVSASATATLSTTPGVTYTEAQDVVNAFAGGAIIFEYPLAFTLVDAADIENIHIQFDTDASVYVVSYSYQTYTWNFAAIRPALNAYFILEEGIQQIRHSPPYGITIVSQEAVDYYGIHTFVDFNQVGGTITAHTSQHVFRGEDGTLTVDAEDMEVNSNALVPNTVVATGESDIRSDETFDYTQIVSNLASQGYNLVLGNTYYFSLRKTWTISTDGASYDLTRMCEPMPVVIP
jgi:hypothetical protein